MVTGDCAQPSLIGGEKKELLVDIILAQMTYNRAEHDDNPDTTIGRNQGISRTSIDPYIARQAHKLEDKDASYNREGQVETIVKFKSFN